MSTPDIKATVRERYGKAALQVTRGAKSGCCGGSCGVSTEDPITSNLYTDAETATLPAEAVLASATRVAAEALGLGDEVGTLEAGKRADLIAVEGNPLADLRALRRVRAVLRDGRVVARDGQVLDVGENQAPPTGPTAA